METILHILLILTVTCVIFIAASTIRYGITSRESGILILFLLALLSIRGLIPPTEKEKEEAQRRLSLMERNAKTILAGEEFESTDSSAMTAYFADLHTLRREGRLTTEEFKQAGDVDLIYVIRPRVRPSASPSIPIPGQPEVTTK